MREQNHLLCFEVPSEIVLIQFLHDLFYGKILFIRVLFYLDHTFHSAEGGSPKLIIYSWLNIDYFVNLYHYHYSSRKFVASLHCPTTCQVNAVKILFHCDFNHLSKDCDLLCRFYSFLEHLKIYSYSMGFLDGLRAC